MTRFLLPLCILGLLVALLGYGLTQDPRELPSVLVDKPAPEFRLPALHDPSGQISVSDLTREPVSLLNVWASWCVACRQEHPLLMRIAETNEVPIYGLNYKDQREAALGWLQRYGNPYRASAYDNLGKTGIDFGVYGVPETFVIDSRGVIRHKHIGPITQQDWIETIQPIVRQLQEEQA